MGAPYVIPPEPRAGLPVPLIPREVLFGNPRQRSPAISPDGERLAYLSPDDGVLNVWVGRIGSSDFRPVTHDRCRGVSAYFWAHDNRHLLHLQDTEGDENWRLRSVDLTSGEVHDLTPFDGVQAQVLSLEKRFPHHLLLGLNRDNPQFHDVYRLDLRTRALEKLVDNPGFTAWLVDAHQRVRGGVEMRADGGLDVVIRDGDQAEWRPVVAFDPVDAITSRPIGFTSDGRRLLLISSVGVNAGRLVTLDPSNGATEVVAEDATHDVLGVLVDPDSQELQAVSFFRDRRHWVVIDPSIEDDVNRLRALHRGDLNISGRDHADRNWLVTYTADDGPVTYHTYDRRTGALTFLFAHRPELDDYVLARMTPFRSTARDGLEIHGYLSFPPGAEQLRDLPAVLLVHGGPWTRDYWGFHPEAQWLANRGYLCVQINYRGSTGYGKSFTNAGDREWGGRMHGDLLDGVTWLVEQRYADSGRIAIYGGSYGGYAALVGLAFTPEVFCCGVDLAGPSNLKTFIASVPEYWRSHLAFLHTRIGDPATDGNFLTARSPLSRVERISKPLLIAQGANDPRVRRSESEQIVAALRTNGIPVEYLLFPDEGHDLVRPENRLRFYAAAERFLGKHVGGRVEP